MPRQGICLHLDYNASDSATQLQSDNKRVWSNWLALGMHLRYCCWGRRALLGTMRVREGWMAPCRHEYCRICSVIIIILRKGASWIWLLEFTLLKATAMKVLEVVNGRVFKTTHTCYWPLRHYQKWQPCQQLGQPMMIKHVRNKLILRHVIMTVTKTTTRESRTTMALLSKK